MIDPRDDIIGLLTNDRISGSADHGIGYIKVEKRENNQNCDVRDGDLGIMILEKPEPEINCISVTGRTYEDNAVILCNLFVNKNEMIENNPITFITNIIDSLQNTIIDNRLGLSACKYIYPMSAKPIPSKTTSQFRYGIRLMALNDKVRS